MAFILHHTIFLCFTLVFSLLMTLLLCKNSRLCPSWHNIFPSALSFSVSVTSPERWQVERPAGRPHFVLNTWLFPCAAVLKVGVLTYSYKAWRSPQCQWCYLNPHYHLWSVVVKPNGGGPDCCAGHYFCDQRPAEKALGAINGVNNTIIVRTPYRRMILHMAPQHHMWMFC